MQNPEKWLVAVEDSSHSRQAVEYAARMYDHFDAKPEVLLIHVLPSNSGFNRSESEEGEITKKHQRGRKILKEARETFEKISGDAPTVTTMLAFGEVREVIVNTAKKHGTDHIIMGGSDMRWKLRALVSGGVINYVQNHLDCAVTVKK